MPERRRAERRGQIPGLVDPVRTGVPPSVTPGPPVHRFTTGDPSGPRDPDLPTSPCPAGRRRSGHTYMGRVSLPSDGPGPDDGVVLTFPTVDTVPLPHRRFIVGGDGVHRDGSGRSGKDQTKDPTEDLGSRFL